MELYNSRKSEFESVGMELENLGQFLLIGGYSDFSVILETLSKLQKEKDKAEKRRAKEKAELEIALKEIMSQQLALVSIDGDLFYLQGKSLSLPKEAFAHIIGKGGKN